METRVISTLCDILATQYKISNPVHEEEKAVDHITYIAIYLYNVGCNPTHCDDFHVLLFTILICLQVLPNTVCIL